MICLPILCTTRFWVHSVLYSYPLIVPLSIYIFVYKDVLFVLLHTIIEQLPSFLPNFVQLRYLCFSALSHKYIFLAYLLISSMKSVESGLISVIIFKFVIILIEKSMILIPCSLCLLGNVVVRGKPVLNPSIVAFDLKVSKPQLVEILASFILFGLGCQEYFVMGFSCHQNRIVFISPFLFFFFSLLALLLGSEEMPISFLFPSAPRFTPLPFPLWTLLW